MAVLIIPGDKLSRELLGVLKDLLTCERYLEWIVKLRVNLWLLSGSNVLALHSAEF